MRRLLAISSATAEASVAFMQEGAVVAEQAGSARRDHAETLLELIDAVLKDAGCAIEAVDAYAVTRGPGAFTVPGLMKVVKVNKPRRPARKNVPNPFRPGEFMDVAAKPASKVVKVRPLKGLKEMV